MRFLTGLLLVVLFVGCSSSRPAPEEHSTPSTPTVETDTSAASEETEVQPTFTLSRVTSLDLDGWNPIGMRQSLDAFQRSCEVILNRPPSTPMVSDRPAFGTVRDWTPACEEALSLENATNARAQRFFLDAFRPHRVAMGMDATGLFTGYYEPQLHGSREKTATYSVPLHRPPSDLIRVDLGEFRSSLKGERLFGRVDGQRLVPYYERAEIADGKLDGRGLEIAWVDSRVDKFFLQIQGSGRVLLRDSSLIRVGYAGANGRPYRAIGRDLIEMGEVPREEMSMQAIRTWLAENPKRVSELLEKNRSYVFFQERTDLDASEGPIGAQGVPLTPEVSLAVDARFLPYGAPLWLSTMRPMSEAELAGGAVPADTLDGAPVARFRQMMIAQDTGGAIRGAVRGDVFWGAGDRAADIAGRMKSQGTYVVFLPQTLSANSSPSTR
jgi:membrane-bound lytic murein transglycosylase A